MHENHTHTPQQPALAEHPHHDHSAPAKELSHSSAPQPDMHSDHAGHAGGMHAGHATLMRDRFWLSLALTIPVLLYSDMLQIWLGFRPPVLPLMEWIAPVFSTLIFILGGLVFLNMARGELALRQPGMMTLISTAITTSYIYSMAVFLFASGEEGFFWELATLIDVMLLGHWIELRSVGQAQGALRELAKLLPDQAERILPSGETEIVPANQLQVGNKLLIRPGASIPADGQVIEGASSVNESMLTGESKPVHKHPGETVIAGSVNQTGSLRVIVTKVGADTALAGIMRLVQEAQESKSRAQTLAQRAAYYLTLIAIGAGLLTLLAWWLGAGDLPLAVRYTVTVLVIAYPHALGLAVPLVVAISTTLSARNGLLVRQRVALETAKDLNVIIFDKTGTLTQGEQGIVTIAADGISPEEALGIAAGVEADSEHPIAQAIQAKAVEKGIAPASGSGFNSLSGRGVQAVVNGEIYFVGGPRLLQQQGWSVPVALQDTHATTEAAGQSAVYLANASGVLALFAIADVIREESREAVRRLHEMGLKVAMLTGDSQAVARAVAAELGIDTFFAEVLPEHKADKVRELQKGGVKVAMVGDGVNDAPALVTADVGIAIGAGTDVAIESAGIILVRSNPLDIVKIVRLSRATYRKMIQNLVWATGYNVVAIPLAMGILAPIGITLAPAVGAALMSVSTVIVAINAQLLRGLKLADAG